MNGLTDKQQAVLESIRAYVREHGCGPTVRELCDLHGKTACTIQHHLEALRKKGFLKDTPAYKYRRNIPVGMDAPPYQSLLAENARLKAEIARLIERT